MPNTLTGGVLSFVVAPSYDKTNGTTTPSPYRVKYGNDYETRVKRSNNPSPRMLTLSWDAMAASDAADLETLMEGTFGVTKFKLDVTQIYWVGSTDTFVYITMDRTPSKPGYEQVSLKLERVFN